MNRADFIMCRLFGIRPEGDGLELKLRPKRLANGAAEPFLACDSADDCGHIADPSRRSSLVFF
jgi:hypothetical protein